jgi:hypothetical protein
MGMLTPRERGRLQDRNFRMSLERKPDESPWRTKEGIAARYAVSVRTVTNWQRKRILPYSLVGRVARFNVHSCDKAVAAFEVQSAVLRN